MAVRAIVIGTVEPEHNSLFAEVSILNTKSILRTPYKPAELLLHSPVKNGDKNKSGSVLYLK